MKRLVFQLAGIAGVVVVLLGLQALLARLAAAGFVTEYTRLILRYIGINVILAASLNLVNGVAGQFSIGHAGFMAIGAYTSGAITLFLGGGATGVPLGVLFLVSLLAAGLLAGAAGVLVGIPSLRLRGDYLAIVTLGFGEIIRVLILNLDWLGGARGLTGIRTLANEFWVWLFAVGTLVALYRIAKSDFGRTLLAIREDEVAAEAMGVDTTAKKVSAFAIAAFFAGIGGGLFAHTLGYLNPNSFTFLKSFDLVVMVILGGMGSLSGSVLAAFLLTFLLEILRPSTIAAHLQDAGLVAASDWFRSHDFRISFYALLLIGMMILRPNGFLGSREIWEQGWVRRLTARLRPGGGG